MTEKRRAPIEVLERLAMAIGEDDDADRLVDMSAHCRAALDKLRFATAPLRTRAEVDAEIGRIMRDAYSNGPGAVSFSAFTSLHLSRLCSEPTRDEPEEDPGRAARDSWAGVP